MPTSPKGPIVRIQSDDFDTAQILKRATRDRPNVGAVVTFTGLCRDEGGKLAALELEHYAGMAEAEINRIAARAWDHWPLDQLI
ncbi:Molybdopterin synthase catalytic subunit MoaE, partial [hydrothermal vent metagenome]